MEKKLYKILRNMLSDLKCIINAVAYKNVPVWKDNIGL